MADFVRSGDRIFIGALGGSGAPEAQADQAMRQARSLLEAEGATLASIVKITAYVTDRAWLAPAQAVVTRYLGSAAPAQCWTIVAGLVSPEMLVAVELDAVVA